MAMTLQLGIASNAYGASAASGRDITENVIESFDVSPTRIENTGSVDVALAFSENAGNETFEIKRGDFVKVTWDAPPQETYLEGYEADMPLVHNGIHVADLRVSRYEATVAFTSEVDNLHDVSGRANFDLKGYNLKHASHEDQYDAAYIQCGKTKKEVEIRTTIAGAPTFFDKVGTIYPDSPNQVYWWLNVNEPRFEVTKDCVIVDDVQEGQRYSRLESVRVVSPTGSVSIYYPGKHGDSFEADYPGVSYTSTNEKITIRIPKEHLSRAQFDFNYVVDTIEDLPSYANKVSLQSEYRSDDGATHPFNKSIVRLVDNVHFGGDVTGTVKGELKVSKTADDSVNTPIPGVVFTVKNLDGAPIVGESTEISIETDENGVANVKNLPIGRYAVRESSAPAWIEFDPSQAQIYKFEVKDNDTSGIELKVTNKVASTSIPVEKRWVGQPGDKVEVVLMGDGREAGRAELTESTGWRHVFDGLPRYDARTGAKIDYTLTETEVPGYESKVSGDAESGFVVTNTYRQAPAILSKTGDGQVLRFAATTFLSAAGAMLLCLSKKRQGS